MVYLEDKQSNAFFTVCDMKQKSAKIRYGLTLIELVVACTIAIIVLLSLGIVLVDNQKGYRQAFNRVHGEVATDADVARIAFDAIVRKSSINRSLVDVDGQFVEVYYYNDASSALPDRFAKFYCSGSLLLVDYGQYDWNSRISTTSSTVTLARNVKSVKFSVQGVSIQMVLSLDDEEKAITVTSSSVRHN